MDSWAANDPDFAQMIGWTETELPFNDSFSQIWSLHHTDGILYAGTKPANLLASKDMESGRGGFDLAHNHF